jgi:carboxyl-terminal processing protease
VVTRPGPAPRRAALAALLALPLLLAWAAAQPAPAEAPRPIERTLAGEPPWAHPEGRERIWRELVTLFADGYYDADHRDWSAWGEAHRAAAVEAEDRPAFDAALRRMVREIADGHSAWLGLADGASGVAPAGGAGAPSPPRLGVQLAYVDGRGLVVERVYPTTPADDAGLRRADVITQVGERDLTGVGSLFEANAVLADALAGGAATLRVERGRSAFEVDVRATEVALGDVASHPYALLLDDAVGYLHVPTFNEAGVGTAVHDALRGLVAAGARSLVLDLRGNLGGRLMEAGLVVGAFLDGDWARAQARGEVVWRANYAVDADAPGGPVGVARLVDGAGVVVGEARTPRPFRFHGPLVVVVGSESASAGEIVPAALLDAGRARVVGEATTGNVEAVRAYALSDGSRVLVAIALLEGAAGTPFDQGVRPEVVARASVLDLARGVDPPVAEARRLLGALPFTPGRWF